MTITDKLKQFSEKELCEIWCKLNVWQFHEKILEFKPDNWDLMTDDVKSKFPIFRESIDYINSVVPEKEISREWNKNRMSHEEFEVWWVNKPDLSVDSLTEEEIAVLKHIFTLSNPHLN